MQPLVNNTVRPAWGNASPNTSARALHSSSVPAHATTPPMSVVRFFAIQREQRSENSATAASVTKQASRCTSMRFSAMLLLSVSCSQNDPENAMVFHAIQHPKPRYVSVGACRSMDASAFENRSLRLASF